FNFPSFLPNKFLNPSSYISKPIFCISLIKYSLACLSSFEYEERVIPFPGVALYFDKLIISFLILLKSVFNIITLLMFLSCQHYHSYLYRTISLSYIKLIFIFRIFFHSFYLDRKS